jgi:hypothetical protein
MANWRLFGFSIGDPAEKYKKELEKQKSFSIPTNEDGAVVIQAGGVFGTYVDLDGASAKNEVELITKYREMSLTPEASMAIDDIVNEAIVMEDNKPPVKLITDDLPYDKSFKGKLNDEFDNIIGLLDFNNIGYEIFRRWYVDGRLYFHIIIDEENPHEGIKELRYIDPRKIRKVREIKKKIDNITGSEVITDIQEYYIFNEKGIQSSAGLYTATGMGGVKISVDSICYVNSGLVDAQYNTIVSHLHKAIKPLNQLRMIEDAIVIYRLSRAPERRIFYIDVGNLTKTKAEAYLKEVMQRYRNKLVYDSNTGEIRDDKRHLSMLEDFWLPRREGGKGTEVSTLQGGQNLGEIQDVMYFKEKLYRALDVPLSRLQTESGFSLGRASEITRDELKFTKAIHRMRIRFSHLFDKLLKIQCILKGIIAEEDWEEITKKIYYKYQKDSYFSELKNSEILQNRATVLQQLEPYVGKYYSKDYVYKNVLLMNEEEIEDMKVKIETERKEESENNLNQFNNTQNDMNTLPFDPNISPDDQNAQPQNFPTNELPLPQENKKQEPGRKKQEFRNEKEINLVKREKKENPKFMSK